eukprot:7649591-Lingulodinium_polyedra.AAC.1
MPSPSSARPPATCRGSRGAAPAGRGRPTSWQIWPSRHATTTCNRRSVGSADIEGSRSGQWHPTPTRPDPC